MVFFDHAWAFLIFVINLVIFAGVIGVAFYAINRLMRGSTSDSALKLLNERFARGEIDQQEYEQRRAVLTRKPQA